MPQYIYPIIPGSIWNFNAKKRGSRGIAIPMAAAFTLFGSTIRIRYLKLASIAHILQGALFIVIAFTPFLLIAAAIYVGRMAVESV